MDVLKINGSFKSFFDLLGPVRMPGLFYAPNRQNSHFGAEIAFYLDWMSRIVYPFKL